MDKISRNFEVEKLSNREREILELAGEGMTDAQIALKLDISPSTVNSYWVRIRGKVGHLSRTEIVASNLRIESGSEIEALRQRIEELETELEQRKLSEANPDVTIGNLCFEHASDAMFALDLNLRVLAASRRACEVLGRIPEELPGLPFASFFMDRTRFRVMNDLKSSFDSQGMHRLGFKCLYYLNCLGGDFLRVILQTSVAETPHGRLLIVTMRTFDNEIEFLKRRLATIDLPTASLQ